MTRWSSRTPPGQPRGDDSESIECPRCGGVADRVGRMYICIDCGHEFHPDD